MAWLLILASAVASPASASEPPALADLVTLMQPYFDCRTPFDRQMIALESRLRGSTHGARPDAGSDPEVAVVDDELATIDRAARVECNYIELENAVFDLLPRGRGNRAYAARDLIRSAEPLRRVQLTYDENLYVWPIPRPITRTPGTAESDQ